MKMFLSLFFITIFFVGCSSNEPDEYIDAIMIQESTNQLEYINSYDDQEKEEYREEYKETGILGRLTRISYGDNTAYIFGSMHVGMADWFPLHPAVYQAMENADLFLFEYDITTDDFVIASMTLSHLLESQNQIGSLIENLTQEERATFEKTIEDWIVLAKNIPSDSIPVPQALINRYMLNGITPFALYTLGGLLAFETVGANQQNSIDWYIWQYGLEHGIEIDGLIPIEQEIELMMNVPVEAEMWLMANFPAPYDLAREAYETAKMYKNQDIEQIAKLLYVEDSEYENPLYQWIHDVIMVERSQYFASEIARLLEQDTEKTFFVTVGIGHMIGDSNANVLQLLSEKGFEISTKNSQADH